MSMRVRTTYLAKCDYPGCCMQYDFWATSEENAIMDITNDEDWLCLFTNDNEPRFFCPGMRTESWTLGRPDWSPHVFDGGSAQGR